ncbi:hypothetical protein ACFWM5_08225 [Streptomyces bobili]|uniref:hypothetical protein n=1 Tax=Streptomyces bobili TaxID=67280 RepID=UPI003656E50D
MTPASSRSSAAGRRPGDDRFRWDWHRGTPPGAELLGDLTDLVVAELGSGAGHRAAHLARTGQPAGIVAVDHDTPAPTTVTCRCCAWSRRTRPST